jgi:hypothetical protein
LKGGLVRQRRVELQAVHLRAVHRLQARLPVIACEHKAGHQFAPSAGPSLWSFFSQF